MELLFYTAYLSSLEPSHLQYLTIGSMSLVLGTFSLALLWWVLAIALSPSQYLPLGAAALAFGTHSFSEQGAKIFSTEALLKFSRATNTFPIKIIC